jgi:hypothetical protein
LAARDCAAHPIAEAVNRKGLAVLTAQDSKVCARCRGQDLARVRMNGKPRTGLLLRDSDGVTRDVRLGHPNVASSLSHELPRAKHQPKRETLFGANRPTVLEGLNIRVGPGSNFR